MCLMQLQQPDAAMQLPALPSPPAEMSCACPPACPCGLHPNTVQGLPTIRAYGAGGRFRSAFLQDLSENGAWWFCFYTTGGWADGCGVRGCSTCSA